jgi:hypothetical protein
MAPRHLAAESRGDNTNRVVSKLFSLGPRPRFLIVPRREDPHMVRDPSSDPVDEPHDRRARQAPASGRSPRRSAAAASTSSMARQWALRALPPTRREDPRDKGPRRHVPRLMADFDGLMKGSAVRRRERDARKLGRRSRGRGQAARVSQSTPRSGASVSTGRSGRTVRSSATTPLRTRSGDGGAVRQSRVVTRLGRAARGGRALRLLPSFECDATVSDAVHGARRRARRRTRPVVGQYRIDGGQATPSTTSSG